MLALFEETMSCKRNSTSPGQTSKFGRRYIKRISGNKAFLFWFKSQWCLFLRVVMWYCFRTLQWRHNGPDVVSNHQPHDCLLNRLFRRRSKKTSKLRVTGLCAGNSAVTDELPAQMASNAENNSIWWRHHVMTGDQLLPDPILIQFTNACMSCQYQWVKDITHLTRGMVSLLGPLVGRLAGHL